jgi:hypothetical protein
MKKQNVTLLLQTLSCLAIGPASLALFKAFYVGEVVVGSWTPVAFTFGVALFVYLDSEKWARVLPAPNKFNEYILACAALVVINLRLIWLCVEQNHLNDLTYFYWWITACTVATFIVGIGAYLLKRKISLIALS